MIDLLLRVMHVRARVTLDPATRAEALRILNGW